MTELPPPCLETSIIGSLLFSCTRLPHTRLRPFPSGEHFTPTHVWNRRPDFVNAIRHSMLSFGIVQHSVGVFVHARDCCILLQRVLVVVGTCWGNACIHLLESAEVHGRIEQRKDVRVESLPVGVVQVVLLGLQCSSANLLLRAGT